ncbi:MAG TPA: hypothetical protein VLQ93_05185 [Myxococcaceae bacterium]|nr:hypothetical protein [Myxococcaceae bacterium]
MAVFLSEAAPGRPEGERLSDLLNGGAQFIPVVDAQTDGVTFVRCENVAVARVAAELEPVDDAEQFTIPTEHEVEIHLSDGQKLRGLITYVLPDQHSRLLDFLNGSPLFFPLFQEERVALVNKRHVAYVETIRR